MREENLALVTRGYDAFAKGDLDTIRAMMAPDVIWRTPGLGWLALEYKGPDGVMEFLTALFQMTDGTFRTTPLHLFADDERVVVIEHITGTRADRAIATTVVHVYEVHDDKVWEVTELVAEPKLLEAFWA